MTITYPLHAIDQFKPIIVAARKQLGLTQVDVAARLGVTQQTYARMENNLAGLSFGRVLALCQIVGLEIRFNESHMSDKVSKRLKSLALPTPRVTKKSSMTGMATPSIMASPNQTSGKQPENTAPKPTSSSLGKRLGRKVIPEW
ncbi:helix-turn-helix transcriptional regulator [Chitinimonas arctica]|uniref:Helix-turn-helix transcriptional regulator n=1 Tax=Chitinimonas arctica TaxID=2594795 RepID=A0A516SFC5_9NEIS|nr:helix-turn-helix transcriptional regulator [Chitinimonas arctica]QDQ26866.1 helix-turn-helix transcriptional regulator [Chitinimonas arctica]